MRIVGGLYRGRRLTPLGAGDNAAHLRPTTDRLRETIFNILQSGKYDLNFETARVLDIFCGTGALGLESISRGAIHATFIDNGAKALSLTRKNIDLLNISNQVKIMKLDARRLPKNPDTNYDIVFMDPPYKKSLAPKVLEGLANGNWLKNNALIIVEEAIKLEEQPNYTLLDERNYGETILTFLSYQATNDTTII